MQDTKRTNSMKSPSRYTRTLLQEVQKSRLHQQLCLDEGDREKQGVTHQASMYIVDSDASSNVMG